MVAEIVSVGTEILLGQIVDSNAPVLGKLLAEHGVTHMHRQTVGDNLGRLTEALTQALDRSDIVFTIGGLGPTQDDLTRDGIAAALGETMVHDPEVEARLRELFAKRNLRWVDSQNRQAMRPSCSQPIDNPNGTAPGLVCRKNGKIIVALPGPKNEFVPMVEGPVKALLGEVAGGTVIHSRVVRVCGAGEALVEEKIRKLIDQEDPTVAPYAKLAEVHLRVTTRASTRAEAEAKIAPTVDQIRRILGEHVYGFDETTLEESVLDLLRQRRQKIAVAESCTGGGLGARITAVPGSSDVLVGGLIAYSNEVKQEMLDVSPLTLLTEGAVSSDTCAQMALGVRRKFGTDFGVSITGVAGPGGGTAEKPVGLVYVGAADEHGATVEEHRFRGQREAVRQKAGQAALVLLRTRVLESR